jgi:hypothetical protein
LSLSTLKTLDNADVSKVGFSVGEIFFVKVCLEGIKIRKNTFPYLHFFKKIEKFFHFVNKFYLQNWPVEKLPLR